MYNTWGLSLKIQKPHGVFWFQYFTTPSAKIWDFEGVTGVEMDMCVLQERGASSGQDAMWVVWSKTSIVTLSGEFQKQEKGEHRSLQWARHLVNNWTVNNYEWTETSKPPSIIHYDYQAKWLQNGFEIYKTEN